MRSLSRWILALFFIGAGVNHFISQSFYVEITPAYLPAREALVIVSGIAEILGGIGLLLPQTRRLAGWGLIALLVAVLPVHVEMVMHGFRTAPTWVLWLRLPLQAALIFWVWSAMKTVKREDQ